MDGGEKQIEEVLKSFSLHSQKSRKYMTMTTVQKFMVTSRADMRSNGAKLLS